jgi:release factor glutamine methyltransferase
LALADERPDLDLIASDVDAGALAVAADNAGRLGLAVSFVQSDLLAEIHGDLDAVVSNPPYIADADFAGLDPEVRDHEPRIALTSGSDGLDTVRRLIAETAGRGIPRIAMEIGEGQADAASALLMSAGFTSVEVVNDLAGIGRVVAGTKVGE